MTQYCKDTYDLFCDNIKQIKDKVNTPWDKPSVTVREVMDDLQPTQDKQLVESSFILCDTHKLWNDADYATFSSKLIDLFGGYTCTESYGSWFDNETKKTVTERSITYVIAHEKDRSYGDFVTLLYKLKQDLRQDCVYFNYQGFVSYI